MKNQINEFDQVPVVVLCGGKGIMLDEKKGQRTNKGLIQIKNKPLFLWVMHLYALHGATNFILAVGFQGNQFGVVLEAEGAEAIANESNCYTITIAEICCRVRLVPTARDGTTAERLLACKPWLEHSKCFAVTYSDTLSDVNLSDEMRFHKSQKLVATLVATKFPVRFRILGIRTGETIVRAFASRPVIEAASINGGFYIFTSSVWNQAYGLEKFDALEEKLLEHLAAAGELAAFGHNGVWQNCDAERDLVELIKLAQYFELMVNRVS